MIALRCFKIEVYPGPHRIEVYADKKQSLPIGPNDPPELGFTLTSLIPVRYNKKSTLTFDVQSPQDRPEFALTSQQGPRLAGQLAGLFIDEVPLSIPRDLAAEKLHPDKKGGCYVAPAVLQPGQMGYLADGSVVFRWPAGKMPGQARIIAPPEPGTSCVTIACSHIVVRNITVRHAANDGFNIHGGWVGIRLEHVRALSNADEGISAHGTVQMEVIDAEVAWNGSNAGGVADVDKSVTTYRQCKVHDNVGAAFYFSGRSHRVEDSLIYDQARDFAIQPGTSVNRERVSWRR